MPNVSVSNTPGLYIGSGASGVLNSAQQLYALLSNSGNVNFALINNNTAVQSYFIGNAGGGSTYSNTNVAAYLPTYTGTLDNSSTIVTLFGNAATQALAIAATNANLGAFQTYANNTFGSTSFGNANVALYLPTYTGTLDNSVTIINLWSNAAGQATAINGINANLGAFQTFSNANAATQATSINTINANLGAFQTYANNTFGTSSYGNANVAAYLPTYGGTVNVLSLTGVVGQDIAIEPDSTNNINLNADTVRVGDNNTDFTLVSHGAGNLTLTTHLGDANQGNVTLVDGANGNIKLWPNGSGIVEAAGNVKANYYFGDGSFLTNIALVSTYSNSNVAAYMPVYSGNIGDVTVLTGTRYFNSGNLEIRVVGNNAGTLNGGLLGLRTYNAGNLSTTGYGEVAINSGNIYIQSGFTELVPGTNNVTTGSHTAIVGNTIVYASVASQIGGNVLTVERGNVHISNKNSGNTIPNTQNNGGYLYVANSVSIGDKITSANLQSTEGTITNRITAGNVTTANGVFYSNGVNILNNVVGNYSNTNVAAYLVTSTTIITNSNNSVVRMQNTANTAYVQVGNFGLDGIAIQSGNVTIAGYGAYPLELQNQGANVNAVGSWINFYPIGGNPNSGNIGVKVRGNIQATSNITGAYFIGDGSQLTNLPSGSYGNTQVAAYLPTYTGSLALSSSIVSLNANLGAYQTYANANFVTTATQYGNTQVAAYLPTYTGNISGNSINLTFDSVANKFVSTTGYFWSNGTAYSTGGGGGGGSDFTSNLTINGNYILNGNINLIREKWANIGTIQGTTTIDANVAMIQTALVVANITINTNNLTNFNPGQSVTLKFTQGTNANLRILTSNILFAGGSKTLSTANAAIDTVSITYDGEAYLAALVKGYS